MVRCPINNPSFILKILAMLMNVVILTTWVVGTMKTFDCWLPYKSFFQVMIFYHTVPPFMIILPALIFMYIWSDENNGPSDWDTVVYSLMGSLLFEISGIVGLVNTLSHDLQSHGIRLVYFIISTSSMANGMIFFVDVLMGIKNIVSKALNSAE